MVSISHINALEGLREYCTIVADTAEYNIITQYKPQDVTTNPVLIFQAAQDPDYSKHLKEAIDYVKTHFDFFSIEKEVGQIQESQKDWTSLCEADRKNYLLFIYEKLSVSFGSEILKMIPGWVSTQLDPRLADDKYMMLASARRMATLYEKAGWSRERFMIKVPSTWQGIQAAKELEAEGIHVNMTLLFSLTQAVASADINATMISPYVARIQDWWMMKENKQYPINEHPGLLKVAEIWKYFKYFRLKTAILVANCRKVEEVLELSGVDRQTINPSILDQLRNKTGFQVQKKFKLEDGQIHQLKKIEIPDEKSFKLLLNEDAAASDRLEDGLQKFITEMKNLDQFIISQL